MKIKLPDPLEEMWFGEPCPSIRTPMSLELIQKRINETLPSGFSSFFGNGLRGSVIENNITLYWTTSGFANAWRPVFRGIITKSEMETIIEGRFTSFRLTQIFCALWFGFLAFFAAIGIITIIFSIAAIVMIALGVGMVKFGQKTSHLEKEKILSKLQSLTDPEGQQGGI